MSNTQHNSEAHAREVAEKARDVGPQGSSVLKRIFMGSVSLDGIDPFPDVRCERPDFVAWMARFEHFLKQHVDPDAIDREGEYLKGVIDGLRELGAFGMKIPTKYGGLGFSQQEYCRALELLGTYCGNLVALLSAHQSIGVPQPVKLFGTEDQKRRFLPPCARGAISAFALTESDVGSDPARLETTVKRTAEGDYVLDGEKLWTTNGTVADLVVVLARDADSRAISCFVVDAHAEGVEVVHRCRFMGLRAIENGVLRFNKVRVAASDRIGEEGEGLKIALVTLNTGRLSLPAACVGMAKVCLRAVREWTNDRAQWGVPIRKHEAVAHTLSSIGGNTLAMESMSYLCNALAEHPDYDIRLEAAAAKEFNSTRGWEITDQALQVRGGRGFETAASLHARGEKPMPIERMLRDARINRIFEGTSEVMHLFMAREALDKHLRVAGDLVDPKKGLRAKLKVLPSVILFYAWWYPSRWVGFSFARFGRFGDQARHMRFIDRRARKLARLIFHGMLRFGPGLEKKQGFLFRAVETGMELFAMLAVVCRARQLAASGSSEAATASSLADGFCRATRRRIDQRFREAFRNDDAAQYALAQEIADARHAWLERPQLPLPEPAVKQVIQSKLSSPEAAE